MDVVDVDKEEEGAQDSALGDSRESSDSFSQLLSLEYSKTSIMILGFTKDTSTEAVQYLLGFHTMTERHGLAQIKPSSW